jgi:predicted outer membrane repeat protein
MKTLSRMFTHLTKLAAITILLGSLFFPTRSVHATTFNIAAGDVIGLISAINAANDEVNNPGPDVINLTAASLYILESIDNSLYSPNGLPVIKTDITINGNGATIQRDLGAPAFRIFQVISPGKLTLSSLSVNNGSAINYGGAIMSEFSDIIINESTFINNSVPGAGGAIWIKNGTIAVNESNFHNNYAIPTFGRLDWGGAIHAGGDGPADMTVVNSTFSNNQAGRGGAIFFCNGTAAVENSDFVSNIGSGAAITNCGTLSIVDSTFTQNIGSNAGAIENYSLLNTHSGNLSIANSSITSNSGTFGGAIFNDVGTVAVSSSVLENNSATRGGGIFSQGLSTIEISEATFSNNSSTGDGGGIFFAPFFGVGILDVSDTVFTDNSGQRGGAIHTQNGGTVIINNTTFTNNTASSTLGGAFHIHNNEGASGTASINNSCLVGNDDVSVFNESGPQIDASNNWWGDGSGPTHSTNPMGIGDSISSNVTFEPWLLVTPNCPLFDNQPPSVNAGDTYFVHEGGSVEVTAMGIDPEGETLNYAWDLDNNGSFESVGQAVTFSAVGLDGDSIQTINVQATDPGNLNAVDSATVNIHNVSPTAEFSNNGPVISGSPVTLSFDNQFDPSTADTTAGFHYVFACDGGSLSSATYATSGSFPSTNCIFNDGPSFHIVRGRVIDKDEGFSEYTSIVIVNSALTFSLHGTGPTNNPATLFLNNTTPTSNVEKYRDSNSLDFNGGNPWTQIGEWPTASAFSNGNLIELSNFHAWLGLKNNSDQGTRFDLRIEVHKNGGIVTSGEEYCITGIVRNPNLAQEITLSFDTFPSTSYNGTTDILSLKIFTRIGTNGSGSFCGGNSDASGLRLYFDSITMPSRFDSIFGP